MAQQPQPFPFVRRKLWRRYLAESARHTSEHGSTPQEFEYDFSLDTTRLAAGIRDAFTQFHVDKGLQAFLNRCYERQAQVLPFIIDFFSFHILRLFLAPTTTNAICHRGSMHVLSTEQLRRLIACQSSTTKLDRLLDIGAGDGGVTEEMAPLFKHVDVTETNRAMRWRLARHEDWVCHDEHTWKETPYSFDVIACLNVLDRCERPWTLLRAMRDKLSPGGHLIIALVFPYSPYIDDHGARGRRPVEDLKLFGACYEDYVNAFYDNVAKPLGMTITGIARAPYMCEGDMHRPFYVLHDFVFALTCA